MATPKFLICTMWCGENDYVDCVDSILSQEGVSVELRTIKDLIEVDAHNEVYQAFNAAGPDVIRGKVDADVILDPGALQRVASKIRANTWLDPQTHDYFTDSLLNAGLAFYGPAVRFKHQTLTLKCDRDVAIGCEHQPLGRLGRHAHLADEWTGFRYGFHRGLKSQLPVHERVVAAHAKHGDRVRLMAIRGFELAQSDLYIDYHLKGNPPPMDHNYGNTKLRELFDAYKDESVPLPPRTWR
jgi:hypothetical protein